ncbi:MAG: nickel pincer cofactor biosynthesis protein LarB [Raoultibacter sp.]
MEKQELHNLLEAVSRGEISVNEAEKSLRTEPFTDLGFAKIDNQRGIRQGVSEIIYGEGKTTGQIKSIAKAMVEAGQDNVLITRLSEKSAKKLEKSLSLQYFKLPRIGLVGSMPVQKKGGNILVAAAGTSDLSVAEEAALTAEFLGNKVIRLYDVGVAGIHRLLAHTEDIMEAKVIIAVAGMEGALPSVVAGMASCPVIAVPTSVGYGASFGGAAALLAMLNSCASGVSVVNIDNGFGAGYQASMINQGA